jgi:hypothetical protein
MKHFLKLISITILILFFKSLNASNNYSSNNSYEGYQSVIKLDISMGGLHYEYKYNKQSSLNMFLQLSNFTTQDKLDFQITPEYKFYLSRKNEYAKGFYVGSYLFYKDYLVARDGGKDYVKTAGLGLLSGYQWIIARRFTLDFGLGLGYNIFRDVSHKTTVKIIDESTHYLNFTGELSIGYSF